MRFLRFVVMLLVAFSLVSAVTLTTPSSTEAASIASEYKKAWQGFRSLVRNKKRGQYRSYWKKLEEQFVRVYKRSPKGSYAPKALYFAGRTNEELGLRSHLKSDFRASVDFYKRAVGHFPRHDWADDCLYRKAYIEYAYLNDSVAARRDLNTILRYYKKGDMYNKSIALHRKVAAGEKGTSSAKKAKAATRKPSTSRVSAKNSLAGIPRSGSGGTASKTLGRLRDVRFQSSNEYTRVVLDMSQATAYHYQILSADPSTGRPFRLYVDLENTVLDKSVQNEFFIKDGILRKVRTGKPTPKVTRVVLDFNSVQKYHVFSLDNPFRVVVDVTAPKKGQAGASSSVAASKPRVKPKKPAKWTPPKGSRQQVGDLIEQLGLTVKTIMIDAGHGGKDPGAVANGIREKDYVLKMSRKVGERLERAGFDVIYTRRSNVFVPLEERTAMANVRKVDLFLSLHINAHRSSKISGLETYYLNLARSKSAVRVAARENAVTEKRISDLQFILTDLMLNSKVQESKDLASLIQKNMVSTVKKRGYATKSNGVRSAPFYVLMGAKMPAVLVELGYCTNRAEAKRLKSDRYLNRLADGIVTGVRAYRTQLSRYSSL